MMDVFQRYAPFIQDYIYRSGWQTLRGVQNAAGEAIFGTEDNVLLTASTASGKTEAAFFPILTLLDENPSDSVGVLYIAPLKALINDQFERLDDLCREAGISVTRWHGDAPRTQKRKLLKKPSGILQITPESLESLMINKHMEIPSLFGDLRFLVIDEIHSLLRGDRGMQTFCLIERLCKWRSAAREGSDSPQPSEIPKRRDVFSPQAADTEPSFPGLTAEKRYGGFPWNTSITRRPRRTKEEIPCPKLPFRKLRRIPPPKRRTRESVIFLNIHGEKNV